MQKSTWHLHPSPPEDFFTDHAEYSQTLLTLLYHRGQRTAEQIETFLHPSYDDDVHDPFLFLDMQKTVDRLFQAMEKNEHIVIYGDYDADGVSGAVLLANLFRALQYKNTSTYLPHRERDGYGLNERAVNDLASAGAAVIITCDCGISNAPEIEHANTLGIDVIVTDHHSMPPELPPAYAIIHPKRDGETYPDDTLAGGAVAFKLLQAMLREHAKTHEKLPNGESYSGFEKWQLDLCAIACVADMVPLRGEARTLTKYGLLVLAKARRMGLRKLYLEAGIMHNDGSFARDIDTGTIGFQIAPRINAAGRLAHANAAYALLMEENGAKAVDLAFQLEQTNTERKEVTARVTEAAAAIAKQQADEPLLMVYGPDWPPGITGLVAGRLVQQFGKPAFVLVNNADKITASGRSIEGFNMVKALQATKEHYLKFGGHPMACGFSIAPANKEKTLQALRAEYTAQTAGGALSPVLEIDATLTLADLNWDLWDTLELLEPYGQQNPKPTFLLANVTVERIEALGREAKHLKLFVSDASKRKKAVIGWQKCAGHEPNMCDVLQAGDVLDIVVELAVNEWNGNRELRLELVDLRSHESKKT